MFPIAVVIWIVTAPFDPKKRALHKFTCFWASLYSWFNPAWRITIRGGEELQKGATYMFVANHLSLLDILVLFRLFYDFKWVSKAEIFRVPVIGWNMRMNKYIPLRRGDRESVTVMMAASAETLAQGSSIMMFPEGTRSVSGELQPFKTGAFELALEAAVPIVPIVIRGTHDALPKHGFVLRGRHDISVTVLPPFLPEGSVDEVTAETRRRIAEELASAPA